VFPTRPTHHSDGDVCSIIIISACLSEFKLFTAQL